MAERFSHARAFPARPNLVDAVKRFFARLDGVRTPYGGRRCAPRGNFMPGSLPWLSTLSP